MDRKNLSNRQRNSQIKGGELEKKADRHRLSSTRIEIDRRAGRQTCRLAGVQTVTAESEEEQGRHWPTEHGTGLHGLCLRHWPTEQHGTARIVFEALAN
jgi:hypothetical protein